LKQSSGRGFTRLRRHENQSRLDPSWLSISSAGTPVVGLSVGVQAPRFVLQSMDGSRVTLETLLESAIPLLLLFHDPEWGLSNQLLHRVIRWQVEYRENIRIAVVNSGRPIVDGMKSGTIDLLLQTDTDVLATYNLRGVPCAVLINPDGTIGSLPAPGIEAISVLVYRTVGVPPEPRPPILGQHAVGPIGTSVFPSSLSIGDRAPEAKFRDGAGRVTTLHSFRGHDTVLLFWNPDCVFCMEMLPDLIYWEHRDQPTAPRLVLIARGHQGNPPGVPLRSPVLVDSNMGLARRLGVTGTPMAILLDAQGRLSSKIAAGSHNVKLLLADKDTV
jgi:hypothetical protein